MHSTTSHFKLGAILRQVHWMTPNDLEQYQIKSSPIYVTKVIWFQLSAHFAVRASVLELYHFQECAPNEQYKVTGTPYMCYWCSQVPNVTPFCSTSRLFRVTGHFTTRKPNDLKMSLNSKRSNIPHACVTSTPSPKFHSDCISLYRQLAFFELQAILRSVQ